MTSEEIIKAVANKSEHLGIPFPLLDAGIKTWAKSHAATLMEEEVLDEVILEYTFKTLARGEREKLETTGDENLAAPPTQVLTEHPEMIATIQKIIGREPICRYHISVFIEVRKYWLTFQKKYGAVSLSAFIKEKCAEEIAIVTQFLNKKK